MSTETESRTTKHEPPRPEGDAWDQEFLSQAVEAAIRAALRGADARRSNRVSTG